MKIRFIANSGFSVRNFDHELLLNPRIISADSATPELPGFFPRHATSEVLIPPPLDDLSFFSPNTILFSSTQACHASLLECYYWIRRATHPINIGCPVLSPADRDQIQSFFRSDFDKLNFFVERDEGYQGISEYGLAWHKTTLENCISWRISTRSAVALFIPECPVSRNLSDRLLDPLWHSYKKIRPVALFIGASGKSALLPGGKEDSFLCESATMSPIEAAQLVNFLQPKFVSVCGLYSRSFKNSDREFSMPSQIQEEKFAWALKKLNCRAEFQPLRPGIEMVI